MFERIRDILLRLFGKEPIKSNEETEAWADKYQDIARFNLTAIFAKKLATLAVADSTVDVSGDNVRSEYISCIIGKFRQDYLKGTTAAALGFGSVAVVPYTFIGIDNKPNLALSFAPASEIFVNEYTGDIITSATIIAEEFSRRSHRYVRYAEYTLENGTCIIRQRCTVDDVPASLADVQEWSEIPDEIAVPGCDRLLFALFKSPSDTRGVGRRFEGAPITYGCDDTISQIAEALQQIRREYKNTEIFVGVDRTMFDGSNKLPKNGIFKTFDSSDESLWQVFSPEIRNSAYSWRINQLFEMLEKEVGTSKGILTTPEPATTATQIKRGQRDTWALVNDIRNRLESGIIDLIYCINVLANYYSLTPQGDYSVSFDWDCSLLEDPTETFRQLTVGKSLGAVRPLEIRRFIFPSESLEDARKAVDEIASGTADISTLISDFNE